MSIIFYVLLLLNVFFPQGYSVTTGDFNGDGEAVDAAVGMPRGHGLRGQVIIYDASLTNLHNITGNQIGAYFVSSTFASHNNLVVEELTSIFK